MYVLAVKFEASSDEEDFIWLFTKNIPVPNKDVFLKALIDQTSKLFQRIRWKVFWEEKKKTKKQKLETYGFATEKCAPAHKDLTKFESDVVNLIHSLVYRPNTTKFQKSSRTMWGK